MADVCMRVAVRIRPLLPKEVLRGHQVCVRVVPGASSQVLLGPDRLFSFDHAFGPECGQDEVYEACVRPLVVDALLEGHNATVFCYGQTGSGKTYTLEGGALAEDGGVTDRVAHDVFSLIDQKSESGEITEATVRASYIELYKEELRDLLELQTVHKGLHIRDDEKGNTVVVGATEMAISSPEELFSVLETGNALRHTGSTAMNDKSSRSHAVLTLHLHQCILDSASSQKSTRSSKLCLVDLAGSERAGKTGNTGTRLKESVHINTGLLALGNVIRALSETSRHRNSNAHVPYRDAKITRLLRDSLGGTAHTLMVACVSPSHQSVAETISVLQFASKARHIRNRPRTVSSHAEVKSCVTTWDPSEARVGELEFEVQTLRELLREKQDELQNERDRAKAGDEEDTFKRANGKIKVTPEMSEYYDLAQDAAAFLAEVSPSVPDCSFKQRLEQWQERLNVANNKHQTCEEDWPEEEEDQRHKDEMLKLREELTQCKEALVIDEDILQQKEAELRLLQQKLEKLNQDCKAHIQELEEEREQNRIKTEQLINQQILISRLQGNTFKSAALGAREISSSANSEWRAHSVPLPRHSCAHRPVRKIHSSPPMCSLERLMASFKMRGQLLLAELEEKEQVYCPFMKPQEKNRDISRDAEQDTFLTKMGFRRSLNRTWTNRYHKQTEDSSGLNQESDGIEVIELCQGTNVLDCRECDQQTTPHQPSKVKVRSSVAQRRIQELSVNMRMKEALIKELEKTDKLSRAMDRHGSRSTDGREAAALARISLQSRQVRAEMYHSLQHMRQQRAVLQAGHAHETPGEILAGQHEAQESNRRKHEEDQREQREERDWLEEEEERLLQRRAELKELQDELRRREEVLERREACLQQKNKLEIKRLRSSQVKSQDLLRMSLRLENLEEQIESGKGVSIEELEQERDALQKKRDALESQLKDNQVLTEEEEHCLLELEEALETLDAALEFKNHCIQKKQEALSVTELSSHRCPSSEATHLQNALGKLKELSLLEISELFIKYFNKVVCLREAERSLRWRCEELQIQTAEQALALRQMEGAMQRLALDTDRRLMQQHREHQSNVQLLLTQLKEIASGEEQQDVRDRLQHLEKELFFYKTSSRQLKKKLRELSASADRPLNSQGEKQTLGTCTNGSHEDAHTKTHIATTYTRINATGATEQSQINRVSPQKPSPASSSHLRANKSTTSYNPAPVERSQSSQFGEKMTPVRLCRRDLRQVSPSRLQASGSTTRGRQSIVDTSTETMFEDSIEVTRNADR